MNDNASSFTSSIDNGTTVERLYLNGSTCDTYIVRMLGKLHFKKKLKAEYKAKPQYVEAFRKEFEVGYRLEHPALPKYVALKEEDGCPYILEEYIDGETLTDFLGKQPDYFHSRKRADKFIDELLSAFTYLHGHQVLFLDLKPDNVMMTSVGHQLRLVDLGGCRADFFTGTEEVTKAYAPSKGREKGDGNISGGEWSEAYDIYLIGSLLQYANVPHIYNKVIAKCLKDNPRERYNDVESLAKAITALRHKLAIGKRMVIGVAAMCLISLLYLLMPQGQTEQVQDATSQQTQVMTVPVPKSIADSVQAERDMATEKPVNAENGLKSPSHSQKPKQQPLTDKQLMASELQREMDFAYKKYIAPLPKDSLYDKMCLGMHVSMYMDYVNPVMDRLKKKYSNLNPNDVEAKFAEVYANTVLPITLEVFK